MGKEPRCEGGRAVWNWVRRLVCVPSYIRSTGGRGGSKSNGTLSGPQCPRPPKLYFKVNNKGPLRCKTPILPFSRRILFFQHITSFPSQIRVSILDSQPPNARNACSIRKRKQARYYTRIPEPAKLPNEHPGQPSQTRDVDRRATTLALRHRRRPKQRSGHVLSRRLRSALRSISYRCHQNTRKTFLRCSHGVYGFTCESHLPEPPPTESHYSLERGISR